LAEIEAAMLELTAPQANSACGGATNKRS